MGYVTRNVPVGHPDFGKAIPCACKIDQLTARRMKKLRDLSNLSGYVHLTFENFEVQEHDTALRKIAESAYAFAESLDQWIVFQGGFGTGKTHLAAAIGNRLLELGHSDVIFLTVPDLLDYLRTTYHPTSEVTYDELFDRVRNTNVLILDDLGTESPTAWASEKLFQLLNHRYVHRLPTVITTNHRIDDMDGRIASRLQDGALVKVFTLTNPDYRRNRRSSTTKILASNHITDLSIYQNFTFDTFNWSALENGPRVQHIVHHYIQQEPLLGWLVIIGGHGTGKTHLAAALTHFRLARSTEKIFFVRCIDLYDYLRSALNKESKGLDEHFQQLCNAELLVLDGLSTRSTSSWLAEKLFQIIDHRYITQKPTIFTATSKDLEELDDRIESRLKDRFLCTFVSLGNQHYPSQLRSRHNIIGLPIDGDQAF